MPTSSIKKKTVKKTSKKTVRKTTAVQKKSSSTKKGKNFHALVCAIDGECFWSRDGQILQNLADLHLAFGSMDDEIFLHHVNPEKNDFADWVEYVLQDQACAEALRKAKKRERAQKIVALHLRNYSTQ